VIAELGFDSGRGGTPSDHRIGVRLRRARCASACRCRGRWCGTAAPSDRPAGPRRRNRRQGIPLGCDGTASRAACRLSRPVAPRVGGFA
jgi:hypothetical protein